MTKNQALASADWRWGDKAMIERHDNVFRIGRDSTDGGRWMEIMGFGIDWEAAFADADRRAALAQEASPNVRD